MKTQTLHRPLTAAALLSCALFASGQVHADESTAKAQQALGKQVYETWCIACHGPGPGRFGRGLTGTEALEAKYEGKLPPILDQRTDLTPEFVAAMVRHGVSLMPFFRKTEISDTDLSALGAYLSRLNPALHASSQEKP